MNELLTYITMFRKVYIKGRLGYGKTALAFLLAKQLLDSKIVQGVVSNVPNVLPVDAYGEDDGTIYNRCVIYDEAGENGLDSRTSMSNSRAYGAYARKTNTIWLFPSVIPVDARLRTITIKPLYKMFGNTHYAYMIDADDEQPTKGTFSVNLKDAYGLYATKYIPTDDCGIQARFELTYYLTTGERYDKRQKSDAFRQNIQAQYSTSVG